MIAMANNIQHIQFFKKYEMPITFNKFKKYLILIKDENKAEAEADQFDQI